MICLAVFSRIVSSAVAPIAIPSPWRKPTISLTMEERIDTATKALDKAVTIAEDDKADLYILLIEFDIAVNQTRYKDKVSHYFANVSPSKLTCSIVASSNYPDWHDRSGQGVLVLKEKQFAGGDLVRGLATILARKESFDSRLSTYVEAYLAVQYNALLDLATVNGTNVYGNSWIGPPNMTYSADVQFAAARVLIASININPQLDSQSPPEGPPAGSSGRETNHIGGIIGGVLGGLSLIALVIVGSLFIIRRRHQDSTDTRVFPENSLIPIPYVLQSEKRRRKRHMEGILPQAEPPTEAPPPAYSSRSYISPLGG
ncbi:hypothetical protein VNI00_008841 [Paramarasmius palmivorus]|uniref:Uncharacterized protein n=1 Tax=Paramarasmius palmivorus TaxID=297713 RepID=A0AAW0CUP0_9AGAR